MNYPNPCDTCQKCTATPGRGCKAWEMRFRTIWKQFNAYPKRHAKKKKSTRPAWKYENPDYIRRYLAKSPCTGCQFEILCDVPCYQYLNWYDARMAVLQERYGAKCNTNCVTREGAADDE